MSLPRISTLMNVTEAALRLRLIQGGPMSIAELRGMADLLRYYARAADEMERRLAGEFPADIPMVGNVVSLAAHAALSRKPNTHGKD